MIKWLEGNTVGMALASICGAMLLVSLLLAVVWSLPPSVPDSASATEDEVPALDVLELSDSEPLETYSVITERPVFNTGRQPVINDDGADGEEDLLAEEDVDAPDVELAGVIITPSIRMVTLRDREQAESLVAFEGQPLEGDYGTWQVSRIAPREVTLSSDSGEEMLLKLQVHDVKIEEPPKLEPEKGEAPDQESAEAGDGENDEPLSRAEEIRQRIAQRREELRRAAEDNEKGEAKAPKADYQSAIQSMVSGKQPKDNQDENER